ncbi:MAG: hypothetical protein QF685_07020 [Verrucomicrobiota bacterium]|jgi:hypothetical protein|nr:hypothetical protein [Verrucomicrobiota bacterium]
MKFLTAQEQKVLAIVLFLLLVGMAVKTWRTANPPEMPVVQIEPGEGE